jgi:DNA invertase Pin-like site-specific DNA recombinase
MTMNFGYARVSTRDQDFAGQIAELKTAGCEKVVSEKASGARGDRAGLVKAIKQLGPGDVLIVTRLDRIAPRLATCSTSSPPSQSAAPASAR